MATAEQEIEQQLIPKDLPATLADQLIQGHRLGVEAKAMQIQADPEARNAVVATLKMVVTQRKTLDEARKDQNRPHQDAIKRNNAAVAWATDALADAEQHLKAELSIDDRRMAQEQHKAAEEEAKRIARNAEKRAERAAAKGDEYAAAEIRLQAELEAETAKAAIATQAAPKAKGLSKRQNWKWEATDAQALKALFASGKDPRFTADCLKFDEAVINKIVKAYGETLANNPPPGMRVYYEDVIAVR